MCRFLNAVAAILTVAALAGGALALTPEEVLVVANANSAESVKLAEYYAKVRRIPAENIALIKTTVTYTIARDRYDSQIRDPLAKLIVERKLQENIRCICLMWGMPVRIGAISRSSEAGKLYKLLTIEAKRAHGRLAIDYKLMGTVARSFPTPRSNKLKPLGKLFETPAPAPPKKLPKTAALQKKIKNLLSQKLAAIAQLEDADKRLIASRQLMALHLDLHGLKGLIGFVKVVKPEGAPDMTELRARLEKARETLVELRKSPVTAENARQILDVTDLIGGGIERYS
ncbi:MAG: TIGR03790 family protein, partial [Phycisphaerae bacterium]|nr:TIGR03790 family protein [Phycisphaerae bacterium]